MQAQITSTKLDHISTTLPFSVEKMIIIKHECKLICAGWTGYIYVEKSHTKMAWQTQTQNLKKIKAPLIMHKKFDWPFRENANKHAHKFLTENISKTIFFL